MYLHGTYLTVSWSSAKITHYRNQHIDANCTVLFKIKWNKKITGQKKLQLILRKRNEMKKTVNNYFVVKLHCADNRQKISLVTTASWNCSKLQEELLTASPYIFRCNDTALFEPHRLCCYGMSCSKTEPWKKTDDCIKINIPVHSKLGGNSSFALEYEVRLHDYNFQSATFPITSRYQSLKGH